MLLLLLLVVLLFLFLLLMASLRLCWSLLTLIDAAAGLDGALLTLAASATVPAVRLRSAAQRSASHMHSAGTHAHTREADGRVGKCRVAAIAWHSAARTAGRGGCISPRPRAASSRGAAIHSAAHSNTATLAGMHASQRRDCGGSGQDDGS